MTERSDVLVVGAGTAGLSAAHHLAQRGLSVAVFEARHPFGPTLFKEIGLCLVGLLDPENRLEHGLGPEATRDVTRFSIDAVHAVREAAERLGCPALAGHVERRPMNETEAADLARSMPILRECGARVRETGGGSICVEDDLLVDVRAFHAGLVRGLSRISPATPVERIRVEADGVVAETKEGPHRAEIAILANGPRIGELRADLETAVFPFRGQGARFTSALPRGSARGVVSQFGHENYVVETTGDLVAFGFNPTGRREDVGLSEAPTSEFQTYLLRFARERFPELKDRQPERTWAAPLAFTRDGLPLVGPVPGEPRVLVAAAFCGRGMPLAFEAGKRLSALVAGDTPAIPRAFSLRRTAIAG